MNTTKEIAENYYQAMLNNQGWEDFLPNEVTYYGPLASLVEGKEAVVEITRQFLNNKYTGLCTYTLSDWSSGYGYFTCRCL